MNIYSQRIHTISYRNYSKNMNTIVSNDKWKNFVGKSTISLDMSKGYPLQIIADPRFHMIITRAMKRARAAPLPSKERIQSERSSWSSASIVSSIDLRSPEPKLQNEFTQKIQIINKKSSNRKLLIGLSIFIGFLFFIGIILCIVLPLIFIKKPSTDTGTTVVNSVINQN